MTQFSDHWSSQSCPACGAMIAAACNACTRCRYVFPPAYRPRILGDACTTGVPDFVVRNTRCAVFRTLYCVHQKKNSQPGAPLTMRVIYFIELQQQCSEFICFEHAGFPRQMAECWWQQRSVLPVPATAEAGVTIAQAGGLRSTAAIVVRRDSRAQFDTIIDYEFAPSANTSYVLPQRRYIAPTP